MEICTRPICCRLDATPTPPRPGAYLLPGIGMALVLGVAAGLNLLWTWGVLSLPSLTCP